MNSLISIDLDKNIIYIIIYVISDLLCKINTNYIMFLQDLKLLISFIISIICFYLNTKNYQINNKTDNYIKIDRKDYLYIIFIYILFNIIPFFNTIRFYQKIRIYYFCSNMIFIGILLVCYFENNQLYNHQKLSCIILFLIIFFYPNLYYNFSKTSLMYFICNTIFSVLFYYSKGIIRGYFKYAMNNKYISPFFISAIDAGINFIKNLLVHGYYYFIANQNKKKKYFQEKLYNKIDSIDNKFKYSIAYLSGIILPIIDILVCYYYSPFHQCVSENLSTSISFLWDEKDNLIIEIIIGIINTFFSCVSSEIIILQFCDLEKNTKKKISERGDKNAIIDLMNSTDQLTDSSLF